MKSIDCLNEVFDSIVKANNHGYQDVIFQFPELNDFEKKSVIESLKESEYYVVPNDSLTTLRVFWKKIEPVDTTKVVR